jgi:hypothetical protein
MDDGDELSTSPSGETYTYATLPYLSGILNALTI